MARYLWTQKEDLGPSPRMGHSMTYDATRSRVVLFGGDPLANTLLNDTWEWNGEFWTQVADLGPNSRRDHALCFDPVRNVAIVFGGLSGHQPLRDTWAWDGEDWTQLEDSGPAARAGHCMVFDAVGERIILFGGESSEALMNDTWAWDGLAWTQVEDAGPSQRKNHAMSFDLVHSCVVLFGGDPGNGKALGDTWQWDGSAWTQISNFGASACMRAAMVATKAQIAMFGGINSVNTVPAPPVVFRDTWSFDGKRWTDRQDIGPGPRWGHAMAYDSGRSNIVLFGGLPIFAAQGEANLAGRLFGDTWEHTETDSPPVLPPTVVVFDIVGPGNVGVGQAVPADVTLTGPALTGGTLVKLASVPSDVVQAALNNPNLDVTSSLTPITQFSVAAGSRTGHVQFAAPNAHGRVYVVAYTGSRVMAKTLRDGLSTLLMA